MIAGFLAGALGLVALTGTAAEAMGAATTS